MGGGGGGGGGNIRISGIKHFEWIAVWFPFDLRGFGFGLVPEHIRTWTLTFKLQSLAA